MAKLLTVSVAVLLVLAFAAAAVSATVFFNEKFDSDAAWTASEKKSDFGKTELTSGAFFGDEKINQGLKTSQDAKFYSLSAPIDGSGVTNEGKNVVVSLQVKHEQGLDCGGGYIKIGADYDPKTFDGDTEYWMMFGPDQCGYTKRVHLIFNYKGENLLWKKEPRYPDDKLTHVYTVVVKPENTYEMYIDQELKESGKLEDDWKFLAPKEIEDPSDSKPKEWVDDAQMDDLADSKPDDWDNEPEKIPDADAKKPEDWDDGEDGDWEAPKVPNPKHKGAWAPKKIPNPEYKGPWAPKQIPNPKYAEDANLYMTPKPLKRVGLDIWQVKSGSIFDNIIIGDDLAEVNALVEATWGATKDAEKKAHEAIEAKDKEAAKAAEPPASDAETAVPDEPDADADADAGKDDL